MAVDVQGALKAGYSMAEIAEALAQKSKADIAGARKAGYSDEEIVKTLDKRLNIDGDSISNSAMRALKRTGSAIQTAYESVTGDTAEATKNARARSAEIEAKYGHSRGLEGVKSAYEKGGVFSAGKEVLSQIPGAIVEQAPNLAAGALSVVAPYVGLPAMAALSGVQQTESNLMAQAEAQEQRGEKVAPSLGKAALAAGPQVALDVGSTLIGLKGLLPKGLTGVFGSSAAKIEGLLAKGTPEATAAAEKIAASELAKRAALAKEGTLKTVAKGMGKTAVAEAPTEVAQQMIERVQAGTEIFSPDAIKEYEEAAFGAVKMAPLGGAGRYSERGAAQTKIAEDEQIAAQAKEAADAEAARKGTPEYKLQVADAHDDLVRQRKELQKELIQTAPKKGATEEQIAAHEELKLQRDALDAEIADAKAEYAPFQAEVATLRKEAADTAKRESSDKFLKDVVDNRTSLIESLKELKKFVLIEDKKIL
jgi:hypothetical protein